VQPAALCSRPPHQQARARAGARFLRCAPGRLGGRLSPRLGGRAFSFARFSHRTEGTPRRPARTQRTVRRKGPYAAAPARAGVLPGDGEAMGERGGTRWRGPACPAARAKRGSQKRFSAAHRSRARAPSGPDALCAFFGALASAKVALLATPTSRLPAAVSAREAEARQRPCRPPSALRRPSLRAARGVLLQARMRQPRPAHACAAGASPAAASRPIPGS
jgi:hypothetical protein